MKRIVVILGVALSPALFAAEINNESFTSIGFAAGQLAYKESGTLSSGVKFETNPKTTNIFNYSGGYTAVGDRLGFYINNTSTLSSSQADESWKASGTTSDGTTNYSVNGIYQTDIASSKHQALDLLGGYLLGSGHQLIAGMSYTQSSLDRSGFGKGSALEAFNNANLAPFVGTSDGTSSAANTLSALKETYSADPVGKIRNFTETFTSFLAVAGYKYDSLFASKALGSRVQLGATVGVPMFYSVVNTSQPNLEFTSSLEGFDVGLNAGYGWRFSEHVGLMLTANYYYRVRPELKKTFATRAQTIESTKSTAYPNGVDPGRDRFASIPKNEINYWNVGLSAYWNF